MRRTFLRTLSALALSASAKSTMAHAQPANELRIGIMPFVPYSAILLARQNGWVEEELRHLGHADAKVTWTQFAGGPPVNEAFASGNIDIAALGDTPALVGHASGIDDRLIGLAYKGGGAQALLVRADASYRRVQELRGKKVATLRGGNVHELLVLILAEAGLKLSDVEFINLGLQDMGTALLKGDIDAALAWDPVFTRLEYEGKARVLRDGKGLKNNLNPIIASATILKNRPDYVKAYLRAVERGAQALRAQPEASAKALAAGFGLTLEQTLRAFSRSEWVPSVDAEVRTELARSVGFLLDNRLMRNKIEVDRFVDLSAGAR
ncbi:aliphatic sulfonates family ABC transporter, periplsmic ligand-binding protein [Acidovorax delafieldii 2AN]|jgi:sulfonate transport system substrate-binding protein|uniref:Putative aliphatic sulfonates-binding protein n=1 Tax=Acidovorax delafieldii 2AN TaxID=573060 RepID=C5T784_ACIDE|nr:aliphatic sulfonate ABC transporter substrate-binding protein [Acidovorax delafieldii]EER59652.1 aliphatic sulfonates family ABC transporter, periplsmic ligand-binding protein [Acidovorax delafieldii 2AN]